MKDLGVNHYRFSLSWSRILPSGFANVVSSDGIQYYRNLLDELKSAGIEPLVTIYHWDHPQILEELGGWMNELMVTWYVDYATVVFRELGDMVNIWLTLNEPSVMCNLGYGTGTLAPGKTIPGIGPYLCMHNMLKAHAKAYNVYKNEFDRRHRGKIGLAIPCQVYYPKYPNDTVTPEISFQYDCGWVAHPIFSEEGDYPLIMKERIAENSKLEGYPKSRLPEFTQEEIYYIRGTADFFGLNHYTSLLVEPVPKMKGTPWYNDTGFATSFNESWPQTALTWLRIVPKAFGDTLRKLKQEYNNPLIYVTENGMPDNGTIPIDTRRIKYHHDYLQELLIAVNRDGCDVQAYTVWSLMDNFEWASGYTARFGILSVDFEDPNRAREPKLSYSWFKKLLKTRKLPSLYNFVDCT